MSDPDYLSFMMEPAGGAGPGGHSRGCCGLAALPRPSTPTPPSSSLRACVREPPFWSPLHSPRFCFLLPSPGPMQDSARAPLWPSSLNCCGFTLSV